MQMEPFHYPPNEQNPGEYKKILAPKMMFVSQHATNVHRGILSKNFCRCHKIAFIRYKCIMADCKIHRPKSFHIHRRSAIFNSNMDITIFFSLFVRVTSQVNVYGTRYSKENPKDNAQIV